MKNMQFPLTLSFKIATLSNDFVAKDAYDNTVAYVRQKMMKFVDEVDVYKDETKSQIDYKIKANKWIDFSASYVFTNAQGTEIGRVGRKGWASLWKARYEIYDENKNIDLLIQEENAWVKVLDGILTQLPFVGILSGYLFNPAYRVSRPDGALVVRLKKEASLFGRRFNIEKIAEFETGEEERILLSLMMMILLERRRG